MENDPKAIQQYVNPKLGTIQAISDADCPFVVVPPECAIEDLERLLGAPLRIKAHPCFVRPKSFLAYYRKFSTSATLLFGELSKHTLNAYLDYHKNPAIPSWCDHSAHLQFTLSRAFLPWKSISGRPLSHYELLAFLDEELLAIVDPPNAKLLEAIERLRVSKKTEFVSGKSLSNGAIQVAYEEEVSGRMEQGNALLPGALTLRVPIFEGCSEDDVVVRLRFEVERDKGIRFTLSIRNAETLIEQVFQDEAGRVAEELEAEILWQA